jgi:hypothetical protein
LAEHYQQLHTDSLDLARVSAADGSEGQSSKDGGETASASDDAAGGGRDCYECPHPDCGTRMATHSGLVAHQRNVHGMHSSGLQNAAASQQRKRRAENTPSEQPSKIAANRGNVAAAGKPGTSASGRFLCPVAGCTAQYNNRKDIYDHVLSDHQSKVAQDSANVDLQSVEVGQALCKEEISDDGNKFAKE